MGKLKLLSEKDMRKKYSGIASKASDIVVEFDHTLRLPSRAIWLNHITGGGLAYGKVTEGFGYESTGKSLLALDFAYSAQALGGVVLWGDAEQCFDYTWAKENDLDLEKLEVYDSNEIETFSDWARDMIIYYRSKLINNEPILLVVDSIAALETFDEIDGDMKNSKASYGMSKSKKMNEFYRKRIKMFKKYGICVYMINQVRKKIGASLYEASDTTPGGEATKFYASMRLMLSGSSFIKGRTLKDGSFKEDKMKGEKVGRFVYVDVMKNKTAATRKKVKAEVYFLPDKFGYVGFNRYSGLDSILIHLGKIKQKGSRFYYKGKEGDMICNGAENFIKLLHEDDTLKTKLIRRSGINTIGKTREHIEGLGKNLYPVKLKEDAE